MCTRATARRRFWKDHDRCFTWSVHCAVNFPFGFSEKHAPHLGKDRSSLDTALERGSGDAEMLDAVSESTGDPRLL